MHCEVWAGFIFVNFARKPEQSLREFLGPMVTNLEGYPFDRQTSRFGYSTTIQANWKLYMDAFAEFYHAPVLHSKQSPEKYSAAAQQAGFEAPHYQIEGPHRLVSTSGVRFWEMDSELLKPMEILTRSGLFGPWDKIDLGDLPAGVNPAGCDPWGLDSFQLFPNFVILIWSQGWYLTYHYWPTSHNTHVFEGNVYFMPARNIRERVAQEMAAVTFKEFALQDSKTLEATQMMLETRYVDEFLLNDQEILCRHLHVAVRDWVNNHEGARA
ncbi:Rieske (2Fe-2S) domain protein [Parafrankia sp. EAN1pec]|nr:Rieske (2Fe-2S) domain protein [Frankia sp. EAN1pec]